MPRQEQNLGFAGRIASAAGRINRFNPGARVAGAVLGRVGVSHDSLVGKSAEHQPASSRVNPRSHGKSHGKLAGRAREERTI